MREVVINNKNGLHSRPATMFVDKAQKFKSEIQIKKNGMSYNAKSIVSILTAGISKGDIISIEAKGEDESLAEETLVSFVSSLEK